MDRQLLTWFTSLPARITLGLAAMGAVAASLPVADGATFSTEKVVGIASAIGAWLWSEVAGHPRPPHSQDLKLFALAVPLIDPDLDWIKDHDFGNSFPATQGTGLMRIAQEWRGPAYEFHDKKLAAAWTVTKNAIDDFAHMLVLECGPVPSNSNLFTVKTHQDFQTGKRSDRTVAAAASLNHASARVGESWDKMVALAIKRLGISALDNS